ncbi:MAG: IclR family transcriptional regulator [Myxococcales bacterium]
MEQSDPTQPTAIDKALDVLFHLHGQAEPQGVSDIGRALSLPKSSAHRMLAALRRRGLVEQDESGRYLTGPALLALGLGALEREPLVAGGHAVLEEQAAALGETFFLVAARGGRLTVLDKVEGTGLLRASPRIGSQVPALATAAGKLYLAHAPDLLRLSPERERFTEHTVFDGEAFQREMERARADGYAVNRQEWIAGLSVVAAPVFVHGRLLGAVCVALPSSRADELGECALGATVQDAASRIVRRMEGIEP